MALPSSGQPTNSPPPAATATSAAEFPRPLSNPNFQQPRPRPTYHHYHRHPTPNPRGYPVPSSARGFHPRLHSTPRAATPHTGSYVHGSPAGVRAFGFGQPGHPAQTMRPTHLQPVVVGPNSGPGPAPPLLRGAPPPSPSAYPKAVPSPASAHDGNGYKDPRDRNDNFVMVRDRKVKVSGSSSLYAACRSWLRNGFSEETQPHYLDGIKLLPKPSPPPVPDAHSPAEQEPNKEEEEESVEHLSPSDLLKRHVKRAKKVRARLREERLQRIARYKTRLALLLPPLVEQHQFRNEAAAGN